MRIHVLGVPHTITRKDFSTCAFTQKVLKLCAMMHRRGHEVIHYGVEGSVVECTRHVSLTTETEWAAYFTHPGNAQYVHQPHQDAYLKIYAQRLAAAFASYEAAPGTEIIAFTWNGPQRLVDQGYAMPFGLTAIEWTAEEKRGVEQFKSQWQVETGIGYEHAWSDWRVYESYAWMHLQLGKEGKQSGHKPYWAVIPNSFDVQDFGFEENQHANCAVRTGLVYLGRLNEDKGILLAAQLAEEVDQTLTLCGQGDHNWLRARYPKAIVLPPVGPESRRKLLASACAVLTPSLYVEPFCGVHVEAMLSGTPVITTDWGVFPETVVHGVTGYRCRTFEQFVWALKNLNGLAPAETIQKYARDNFSLERVALMYEEYFQSILNLKHSMGFYTRNPNRSNLSWLQHPSPEVPAVALNSLHAEPPAPVVETEWQKAQAWEHAWWGLDWTPKWDEEIRKQDGYFKLLGFPDDRDFSGKSILDVGCGPVSMLLRTQHGFARAVDPLPVNQATRKRYFKAGVEFLNIKAEEMPAPGYKSVPSFSWTRRTFDEIWIYNCLQHVDDPHEILRRVLACSHAGTTIRIFEWIDLGVCPGHPQNLTEDLFFQYFGSKPWNKPIDGWIVGNLRGFGGTATEKFIAIRAVKQSDGVAALVEPAAPIDLLATPKMPPSRPVVEPRPGRAHHASVPCLARNAMLQRCTQSGGHPPPCDFPKTPSPNADLEKS